MGGAAHNAIQHNAPGFQQAMQRSVPQFYGTNMGIGNERFDLTDPRVLAGLAMMPLNPAIGASVMAYGGARQHEQNQYNKQVERQYMPQAQGNALRAQQLAQFGGIGGGGLEQAYGNYAYNDVLNQIAQLQGNFKQKQNQQESQAMGGIGSLVGMGTF